MLWKPIDFIKGIPKDKYEISEDGHIRNKYWDGIREDTSCPIYEHPDSGYMMATLSDTRPEVRRRKNLSKPKYVMTWISRLVATAFVDIPDGFDEKDLTVYHIDGNKQNNHYSNLEWRIGIWKIEDRRRMLEIVKTHYDHFNNHDITRMIQKELGIHIPKTLVASLLQRTANGEAKSKHWRLFGIDPSFFTNKPLKTDPALIRLICETLCRFDGDRKETKKYLESLGLDVSAALIHSICKKYTHTKISDEYFDWDEFEGFIPKL